MLIIIRGLVEYVKIAAKLINVDYQNYLHRIRKRGG